MSDSVTRISAELFDALTRSVGLSADIAASDAYREGLTQASIVHRGVEAAFAHAIGLGLVSVNPIEGWPELHPLSWKREDVADG